MNAPSLLRHLSHPLSGRFVLLVIVIVVALEGRSWAADDQQEDDPLLKDARASFQSISIEAAAAQKLASSPVAELGRKLFFDPRVSADGVWGCMVCHQPALYATDAQVVSRGVFDKPFTRNAPTILNTTLQFRQHWDGGFESVEAQATHAILGPGFGNPDNATAMGRLKAIPGYAELFAAAFPDQTDPVTAENWGIAIGTYERTLLTPSRFDAFLDGKSEALTAEEKLGVRTFLRIGCANCHDQRGLGGNDFEKFGVYQDYWKATHGKEPDVGRFKLTKKEEDKYVFKVPPLRNVAMTPPYFHDGSVKTLTEAVKIMASVQLDQTLTESEVASIVTFLKSLTAELPPSFDRSPILPSGVFHDSP